MNLMERLARTAEDKKEKRKDMLTGAAVGGGVGAGAFGAAGYKLQNKGNQMVDNLFGDLPDDISEYKPKKGNPRKAALTTAAAVGLPLGGAIGAAIGAKKANNKRNKKEQEKEASEMNLMDRLEKTASAQPETLMDRLEKTASVKPETLMDRLEKTAAEEKEKEKEKFKPGVGTVAAVTAAGAGYGAGKGAREEIKDTKNANKFNAEHAKANGGNPIQEGTVKPKTMKKALKGAGYYGSASLIGSGLGIAIGNATNRDKEASTLMNRLEKTAAESVGPTEEEMLMMQQQQQPQQPQQQPQPTEEEMLMAQQAQQQQQPQPSEEEMLMAQQAEQEQQQLAEQEAIMQQVEEESMQEQAMQQQAQPQRLFNEGSLGSADPSFVGGIAGNTGERQGSRSVSSNPAGVDQTASEDDDLMGRLQKTAAGIPGIASIGTKAKKFVGDVTGSNAKKANNKVGDFWSNPNNANLNVDDFASRAGKLEANAGKADASKLKAQTQLKQVGGGAAAGAGVTALATSGDKDHNKTASENESFMTELYKEAATAIIDEVIPSVKVHTDPMDRISFAR